MTASRHQPLAPAAVHRPAASPPIPPESLIPRKSRYCIIVAALLTLFLGALDALAMGAAMPTVVADLGGFHLYSWVFSAYLLSRAVSLPIFGKLCDLFNSKLLYKVSIGVFLTGSVLAGSAESMFQLILARALQGLGAGGNFALVYIVLADISSPEQRGKMMSLASFVWGLASVLGPTVGGFLVGYFSWRWIFFINLPLGGLSLLGISLFLIEVRAKRPEVAIDYWGALTLSTAILALLMAFLLAGRTYAWASPQVVGLLALSLLAAAIFCRVELMAEDPILCLGFLRVRGFSGGNAAAFFSSFAIFSLLAFSPVFIQGALGKTPTQLGVAMVPLSLGWSIGALFCGQLVNRLGQRPSALAGSFLLMSGCGWMLAFSPATSLLLCAAVLALAGLGMGFVSISTLLMVQNSLDNRHLGVATSAHQFTRTLGGTVGVGISGSLVTALLARSFENLAPGGLADAGQQLGSELIRANVESLLRPEFQSLLGPKLQTLWQAAVMQGVRAVFWAALLAAALSLFCSYLLPGRPEQRLPSGR